MTAEEYEEDMETMQLQSCAKRRKDRAFCRELMDRTRSLRRQWVSDESSLQHKSC